MLVTVLCRRFRSRSAKGARFSEGTSNARSPSKLSAVTQPRAASSPSACSTRDGSNPVWRTTSLKNNAPACDRVFRICSVSGANSPGISAADSSSHSETCSRTPVLGRGQTSPANATGKAKLVEPLRRVLVHTRRQYFRFPRRRRQFVAIEQLQDRLDSIGSFNPVLRVHMLPGEQKTLKLRRRNRLYLGAQPVDGESMDSRQ